MPDGSYYEGFEFSPNQPEKENVGLESEEGLLTVQSAAENVYADAVEFEAAAMADGYEKLSMQPGFDKTQAFELFDKMYKDLESLQQIIDVIKYEILPENGQVKEETIIEIQNLYDRLTKARDHIFSAYESEDQELALEQKPPEDVSPEPEQSVKSEPTSKPEGILQRKLNSIITGLKVTDARIIKLISEIDEKYPAVAERPLEIQSYVDLLEKHKQAADQYLDTLKGMSEETVVQSDLSKAINSYKYFPVQLDEEVHHISVAIDNPVQVKWGSVTVESPDLGELNQEEPAGQADSSLNNPEVTATEFAEGVRLASLEAAVFGKINQNPNRSDVEQQAANKLLAEYKTANPQDKEQTATQLEAFLDSLGKNAPTVEYMERTTEEIMTAIEDLHLLNTALMVEAVRIHTNIETLLENFPQEINLVDQLIALKNWQFEITQQVAKLKQISDRPPEESLTKQSDEPDDSVDIVEPVATRRGPLPVSSDDPPEATINIDTSSLEQVLRSQGLDSLESDFSDASATDLKQAIFNELPATEVTDKEAPETETTSPISQNRERTKVRRESISQANISEQIETIESRGFGRFRRWFGGGESPVEQLGELPFEQFAVLTGGMSKRDFTRYTQNEYRGMDLEYESFQAWQPYQEALAAYAEKLGTYAPTTKEVVEGYLKENPDV